MASMSEITQLCRLCLIKDEVNVPIFQDVNVIDQIFLKISACLPIKVSKEDKLPKKICDACSYKLELFYDFLNTSKASEKQLRKWIDQLGAEKESSKGINPTTIILKQEIQDPAVDLSQDELSISTAAHNYSIQQQQLSYGETVEFELPQEGFININEASTVISSSRKRPAESEHGLSDDSEYDDDVGLVGSKITKMEDDEDSEIDADQTAFIDLPSGSGENDQAGPSGVGKETADAPSLGRSYNLNKVKIKIRKIDKYKQRLYKRLYRENKRIYQLENCVVFLGNLKNFERRGYVPSGKMLRYLHKLKGESKKPIKKVSLIETEQPSKPKAKKNFVIFDDSDEEEVVNSNTVANHNIEPVITSSNNKNKSASKTTNPDTKKIQKQPNSKNRSKQVDGVLNSEKKCVPKAYTKPTVLLSNKINELTLPGNNSNASKSTKDDNPATPTESLNMFGNEIMKAKHQCSDCKQMFKDFIQLKRHRIIHKIKKDEAQQKKSLSCYMCMAKFSERTQLWSHIRIHSSKILPYKCSKCNQGYKCQVNFNKHNCTNQTNFKCTICEILFKSPGELKNHQVSCKEPIKINTVITSTPSVTTNKMESELKYRCSICKMKFADVLQMRQHKKKHIRKDNNKLHLEVTGNTSRKTVLLDSVNSKNPTLSINNPFNITPPEKINEDHTKSVEGVVSKDNTTQQKLLTPPEKINEDHTKSVDGVVSKDNTTQQKLLKTPQPHIIEQELKPKFKCCGSIYKERTTLFLHMRRQIDSGCKSCSPVYVCRICDSEFGVRFDWYTHCKDNHANLFVQKNHKSIILRKPRHGCKRCYMKFDTVPKLKSHFCTDVLKAAESEMNASINVELRKKSLDPLDTFTKNDPKSSVVRDNSDHPQGGTQHNLESHRKYRCETCYDVFNSQFDLTEHEAFHKEIQMGKEMIDYSLLKVSNQNTSFDKSNDQLVVSSNTTDVVPNQSVNHINIAVNLPNKPEDLTPQQSLVTILIGSHTTASGAIVGINENFQQNHVQIACQPQKPVSKTIVCKNKIDIPSTKSVLTVDFPNNKPNKSTHSDSNLFINSDNFRNIDASNLVTNQSASRTFLIVGKTKAADVPNIAPSNQCILEGLKKTKLANLTSGTAKEIMTNSEPIAMQNANDARNTTTSFGTSFINTPVVESSSSCNNATLGNDPVIQGTVILSDDDSSDLIIAAATDNASLPHETDDPSIMPRQLSRDFQEADQAVANIIEDLKKNDTVSPSSNNYLKVYYESQEFTINESETVTMQRPRIALRNISELMEVKTTTPNTNFVQAVSSHLELQKANVQVPINSNKKNEKKFFPTKCADCGVLFVKPHSLRRHNRTVVLKNPCQMCSYTTCSFPKLKAHYKKTHNIKDICYYCKALFFSVQQLRKHKKQHMCQNCNKYYTILSAHELICQKQ